MKTIREIAEEIGVTKQAIFYRINKPPLAQALQSLVSKENGTLMIPLDAEKLIKQAFSEPDTVETPTKSTKITELLCVTTDALVAQLAEKDRQIAELTSIIKEQSKLMKKLIKPKWRRGKKPAKQKKLHPKIEQYLNPNKNTCSLPEQLAPSQTPPN